MSHRHDKLIDDAREAIDRMIEDHRAGAIPSLIAACVEWAVLHGGTDVVKGSLANALQLADELEIEMKAQAQ